VDLADLVGDAGVEQDALGGGGLAGVDVRHDADVADLGQVGGDVDGHFSVPLQLSRWCWCVLRCAGQRLVAA
jgi:hypothetical protein